MVVQLAELIRRSENRIGAVHPWIRESGIEIITRAYAEGIYVQFSSGLRSFEEQAIIYGQGRPDYVWNGKKYGSKGNIVSNAKPGGSIHNYGLALDYFLVSDDGKTSLWTVNTKWKRVGAIAKELGYEWGGDWKGFVDYPHIQYNKGLTTAQLASGKLPVFGAVKSAAKPVIDNRVMWGKTELKRGQIGKLTILKPINLYRDSPHESNKLEEVRILKPGEEYRVYNYRDDYGGQYNVGDGHWVTKMDGFIKYETPSKALLARLK